MTNQNETKKQSNTATIIITFIIGLLVGGGAVGMWLQNNPTDDSVTSDNNTEEQTDETALGSVDRSPITESVTGQKSQDIIVPDQEAGGKVTIQFVSLEQSGWVVIHELLPDESLGNALGAQRFDAGISSGGVQLLRVTEVDSNYAAVLYRDNGDRRFDLDLDVPIRDESQNTIYSTFTILK